MEAFGGDKKIVFYVGICRDVFDNTGYSKTIAAVKNQRSSNRLFQAKVF